MARHGEGFSSRFFSRTWIRGGSRVQPIHLTMSCTRRDRQCVRAVHKAYGLRGETMVSCEYLILFIQDKTEDLGTVSLLDASPPGYREHVMVLGGVAVIGEGLLQGGKGGETCHCSRLIAWLFLRQTNEPTRHSHISGLHH